MKDNDLIALLATHLEAAVAAAGWDVEVIQSYQPTQEGIPTKPSVSFTKLFDHEYGWPMDSFVLNTDPPPGYALPDFTQFGEQWVESTFQITSLSIQNVGDVSRPTASDIAHQLKLYINARVVMELFRRMGASVLRITDIRNPQFRDDRDLFESSPNFDVVLQHKRKIVFSTPGSNIVVGDIYGTSDLV